MNELERIYWCLCGGEDLFSLHFRKKTKYIREMKPPGSDFLMLDGLAARLAESGVDARVNRLTGHDVRAAHAILEVEIDGVPLYLQVETKSRWTSDLDSQLDRMSDDGGTASWILLLPRLDATRRAWLRERGINHADMTGALYLRMPGVRIHVDGGPKRHWGALAFTRRPVNPFSKKASLVLRQFFEVPHASHSVSALARDTGIAIGWASDVAEELFQRGYTSGTGDAIRLADSASALMHWSASYNWKKSGRRNFVVPYTKAELETELVEQWQRLMMPFALTLLGGAQRRVGHVVSDSITHVYALPARPADLDVALAALHAREVAEPVSGTHTLCLLHPYYGEAALFGERSVDGAPVVSDLQLFLDLAHYPVRGVETAMHVLRTRLGPSVGLTPTEVARIERSIA
jgi:hypothetical protein